MTPGVKPKPLLLSLVTESPQAARLAEDICEVVQAADHGDRKAAITRFGPRVQAVLTHGVHGLTAAEMDRMPRLSIVCSMGAAWRTSTCAPPAAGASRSARGPARTPPPRRTMRLRSLAEWADILVLALPAGSETHHLVDAGVLDALGPRGWLVNIARGGIVDTAALVTALREGRVAGAALDVYEEEPRIPPELIAFDNVVLTPHVAGRSPEAEQAMAEEVAANLATHFAGRPLVTPVPG